jgi:two-component system, response regulator RegA
MTTFFIADDTEGKLQMLKKLVEQSGIATTILEARTSEEAKAVIDSNAIDAAFIDYEIPSENGPAIIAHLKSIQPEARIALVSACDSPVYHENAHNAGAEACLCTSYAEDQVVDSLLSILEKWKLELEG